MAVSTADHFLWVCHLRRDYIRAPSQTNMETIADTARTIIAPEIEIPLKIARAEKRGTGRLLIAIAIVLIIIAIIIIAKSKSSGWKTFGVVALIGGLGLAAFGKLVYGHKRRHWWSL